MQYALEGEFNYLLGCASITPGPSGFAVDAVYRNIDAKNIAPATIQVKPSIPVPDALRCQRDESGIPPLLKAYLRFGALVCGEPYWDEDFNCMDLFVLLPLDQLKDRYSKHYMRDYIARDGVYAASQSGTGAAIARMTQARREQRAAQAANEIETAAASINFFSSSCCLSMA